MARRAEEAAENRLKAYSFRSNAAFSAGCGSRTAKEVCGLYAEDTRKSFHHIDTGRVFAPL
jgi:hypothetical protein